MYKVALIAGVLGGCYSPSYDSCTISCTDSCPNSLTCDTQTHTCRAAGTTCSGGGDAGHDAGATGDATGDMDAKHDASPGGCAIVRAVPQAADGGNISIDFGTTPILAGHFVVVTIAARGGSNIDMVQDNQGHAFSQAIKSQILAGGAYTSSLLYYLTALGSIQAINITWATNVTQSVVVGEWSCATPPSSALPTATSSGQNTTGSTTDTGAMNVSSPALVVASLAQTANSGTQVQTAGFMQLGQISLGGTSGTSTNTAAWGPVQAGTVDVTFATNAGASYAGTAAAFPIP